MSWLTRNLLRIGAISAVLAATSLLISLQLDVFSLEGLDEFLHIIEHVELIHEKSQVHILGGVAAKVDQQAAKTKASTRKSASSSKNAKEDVPRADSLLRQLADPVDPVEAWRRFGGSAAQLFDVLKGEPTGILEAMLTHRNMPAGPKPRGKSREKLAENIAVRLEQQYRGY
jgi:hypothetical protein